VSGTDFLYPFIEADETDAGALLVDLARSAESKAAESRALRDATMARVADELEATAAAMAGRFATGGRLFTFGNGGSATDAGAAAALFTRPPTGPALAARSLAEDAVVLSAFANDVGFELVFVRQLIAHAAAGDVALGFSTSGNSDNVLRAFAQARRQGLLTVGLAGYDGGAMAASDDIDHLLVVEAQSIHRIQEVQASLIHSLWSAVGDHLAAATGATQDAAP
jgi:D-sedoheptulose 7-phosphate isomerase